MGSETVVGETEIEARVGTAKLIPLLAAPETVTTTFPLVAPFGTVVVMLNYTPTRCRCRGSIELTVLLPRVDPKFVPVMVTGTPGAPETGDKLVIVGDGMTVKLFPLLLTPLAWTTTFPVVAPDGTGTLMLVAVQLVGAPVAPLKLTVLLP